MKEPKKYSIKISSDEKDILIDIMREHRQQMIYAWNQLINKRHGDDIEIHISAFEQAVLVARISEYRDTLPGVWKQLMNLVEKFRKDAGVKITDLGDDIIQLTDKDGISIIRKRYEWENDT